MERRELIDRASNKAFARVIQVNQQIQRTEKEIKNKEVPDLTEEQLESILTSQKKELLVWNFIAELIEKSNK